MFKKSYSRLLQPNNNSHAYWRKPNYWPTFGKFWLSDFYREYVRKYMKHSHIHSLLLLEILNQPWRQLQHPKSHIQHIVLSPQPCIQQPVWIHCIKQDSQEITTLSQGLWNNHIQCGTELVGDSETVFTIRTTKIKATKIITENHYHSCV